MPTIMPIVEGHGEIDALPALLHRIHRSINTQSVLRVLKPLRVKAGSFIQDQGYRQRHLSAAAILAKNAQHEPGSVLILLDCDDACPAELGPRLLSEATALRRDTTMFVALAYREYETWLLASADTLRGVGTLPSDFTAPEHFQSIRDAKGWLGKHMDGGYDPVRHQASLTRNLSIERARSVPSFDRLYRHVVRQCGIAM